MGFFSVKDGRLRVLLLVDEKKNMRLWWTCTPLITKQKTNDLTYRPQKVGCVYGPLHLPLTINSRRVMNRINCSFFFCDECATYRVNHASFLESVRVDVRVDKEYHSYKTSCWKFLRRLLFSSNICRKHASPSTHSTPFFQKKNKK